MFSILHHDRLNMIDVHTFENKTAAYYTLGCKLNFAETSTLGKILEENGIRKVRPGEKADICVVNTCSVTELADKKCRQTIRKIARQHPGAFYCRHRLLCTTQTRRNIPYSRCRFDLRS